ncbi:hypothetical protein BWD14_07775 [Leptospira santarosai]|uniref:Uncharacterized protein n=1 Tax=Leptospira santarosai TaxID=28183 RepID=A0AB73NEM8_9LEPT|nr:hypothetical protein BWD14_07775 [Leptospira santarosai]
MKRQLKKPVNFLKRDVICGNSYGRSPREKGSKPQKEYKVLSQKLGQNLLKRSLRMRHCSLHRLIFLIIYN